MKSACTAATVTYNRGVIVAAIPIEPPTAGQCWAFHVVNDDDVPIESLIVEKVHYEWGDFGNSDTVDAHFGAIAPGASLEVYREIDTELRTGLTLLVTSAGQSHRVHAWVGRLYAPATRRLEPIPILGKDGMVAELGSWD
jgi:hypothetical protein